MANEWWLDAVRPELSQGDVLPSAPIAIALVPLRHLRSAPLKSGAPGGWSESLEFKSDENGVGHFLYRGKIGPAVVLSHDCEIDKATKNKRITIAPLIPLDRLNADEQVRICSQRSFRAMYVPDVPTIGHHYLDLRNTVQLPVELATSSPRIASMTDDAVIRLRAQLIGFFTRIDLASSQQAA